MKYKLISKISLELPIACDQYIYIDNPNHKICRFCNKDPSKTTFKNKAHSIPEFMGNRIILISTECDSCNSFFNKNYESHLAFYFGYERSALGISGKNGIPKFKHVSNKFSVERTEEYLKIAIEANSNFIEHNPIDKKFKIEFTKNPFIPYAVYKAFVKIAFSFLPLEKCIELKSTQVFLTSKIKNQRRNEVNPLIFKYKLKDHFGKTFIQIHENENLDERRPRYIGILGFNENVFQFHIPNKEFDSINEKIKMNIIPIFENVYDIVTLDLSKKELEKNDIETSFFTYESLDESKIGTDFYKSLLK